MKALATEDPMIKAEIYTELINDMQAQISEYMSKNPHRKNEKLVTIKKRLSSARMESRIYVDEEHFDQWEDLLLSAKATMIKNDLFEE